MNRSPYLPVLILLALFPVFSARAEVRVPTVDTNAVVRTRWVDSVYASLDTNLRIAQLLVIRAWSTKDSAYEDSLSRVIIDLDVGGVCFFKGTPYAQGRLTNRLQQSARTPLLVAIDAEWGLGMRLDSAFDFPYQMTLGAMKDDSAVYRMASQIALDCRRIGVHVNLAPVVDINNNPANPVINLRSFGEDPSNVSRKGVMYLEGLQSHGILPAGKHFPGHGDTDTDSHLSLPLIPHSKERLDSIELVPFRSLIDADAKGMMIAHLYIPAYETIPGLPSTLSHSIVTGLLKERLGFAGFVITDALDMQGVTKYFPSGEIEVRALQAGNDILLLPQDAHKAVTSIRAAADSNLLSWSLIESKCKAILGLKYDLGLLKAPSVNLAGLSQDLNPRSSELLNDELFSKSVTLLRNSDRLLPLTLLDHRRTVSIAVGDTAVTGFQKMLARYMPCDLITISPGTRKADLDTVLSRLGGYDLVLLSIHRSNLYPKDHFGISDDILAFIDAIPARKRSILALFGNPYILGILRNADRFGAILTTYQDRPEAEEAAAGVVMGAIGAQGTLPVTAGGFAPGTGLVTEQTRLAFTPPESAGLTPELLTVADSIAEAGITAGAYPGCEVLLAKDGKVFYYKAFGHPSYTDTVSVEPDDLYDIASITKMAGTTLAVMKLVDDGMIKPDEPIGSYLPMLRNTPKGDLTIREIMAHQAGFQPWIPFYKSTIIDGRPDPRVYSDHASPDFPVQVCDSLFVRKDFHDSIFAQILRSPAGKRGEYKYSDLGFYLIGEMVRHLTGETLDRYLDEQFYRPLGLTTLGYNPLNRLPASRVMPTENDTEWRHRMLRGYVHDPGAAMLGGVAGHAGLFSDAFDLAVIMQMLLNGGNYGGKQYLLPSTIREFTKAQYPDSGNRRGLGFDRPPAAYIPDGPVCRSASQESFGHSGFTGTYAWADPENNLIYIFLSNRVCPDAGNNKLSQMNIRTNLHQAVYDLPGMVKGK